MNYRASCGFSSMPNLVVSQLLIFHIKNWSRKRFIPRPYIVNKSFYIVILGVDECTDRFEYRKVDVVWLCMTQPSTNVKSENLTFLRHAANANVIQLSTKLVNNAKQLLDTAWYITWNWHESEKVGPTMWFMLSFSQSFWFISCLKEDVGKALSTEMSYLLAHTVTNVA